MRKFILLVTFLTLIFSGSEAKKISHVDKQNSPKVGHAIKKKQIIGSAVPQAIIYSTNGDWYDKVPVTLNEDRTQLISFPAPSDITPEQAPVSVGEGLWLDRRGITENTAFTNWTYEEYAALERVPSPDEIMNNLIPDAKITEIIKLPITAYSANEDPMIVREMVNDGLKGATILYRIPGSSVTINYGEPGPRPMIMTRIRPAVKTQ